MAQNGESDLPITLSSEPNNSRMARLPHLVSQNFNIEHFSLSNPVSGSQRAQNDYVDVPLKKPNSKRDEDSKRTHILVRLPERSKSKSILEASSNENKLPHFSSFPFPASPITNQPINSFCKNKVISQNLESNHVDSIICQHCGGCKCESCCKPKKLPSTWIFNKKCHCSADEIVECCTCLCCVKGIFYHVSKDYEMDNDVECSDDPCSCSSYKRCIRWGTLGVMSLFLPCLCLYWPMHGCVKVLEHCYSKFTADGCHCATRKTLLPSREVKVEKT